MRVKAGWVVAPLLLAVQVSAQEPARGLREWLGTATHGLEQAAAAAAGGDIVQARAYALRAYLDDYEVIEGWYGPGGKYSVGALAEAITAAESDFHVLLRSSSTREFQGAAKRLQAALPRIAEIASSAQVPLYPTERTAVSSVSSTARFEQAKTPEGATLLQRLDVAEAALARGQSAVALQQIENLYLESFEPLEARLPHELVGRVERSIHLQVRPLLRSNASKTETTAALTLLRSQLGEVDQFLARGGSFFFGALNSFAIVLREGLEAVLLIGALLALLTAMGARARERMRIWAGAGAGVLASLLTWVAARTFIPVGGASRELVEGITALIAVVVLLYVSHWLFQKTYIHDWKQYLREHLGAAVSHGSGWAMVGLSFAAVYREGFETVLFYQAIMFDSGGRAVLAGFIPGALLIGLVGWGIIQAGVKLPLKRVFAATNLILLYLAFVFLGKAIFNLQESGAFAAHPISWLPAHPALQQLFGFYPLIETILAQAALAVLLVAVLLVYKVRVLPERARQAADARPLAA